MFASLSAFLFFALSICNIVNGLLSFLARTWAHVVRRPPLLVLVGPTAVGKTAVAVRLAGLAAIEAVSADSRQVYRGLDIGTGKPT